MKKLLTSSLMLLAVLTTQAQTKITPTLQKGMTKTYQSTTVTSTPGQSKITMTTDETYTVSDATAEGYTIDVVTSNFNSDADATDVMGQLLSASSELPVGIKISVATDVNGTPLRITNYQELLQQVDAKADKLTDMMIEKIPAMASFMQKEQLKSTIMKTISEEKILKQLQGATSVLTLNGKTLSTGMSEDFVNDQGMKMKRLYFVSGKMITCNAALSMSPDEMKALIIQQVEESAPEQAEMIKQNIDMIMNSGQLKMDIQVNSTYQLGSDNWLTSIKSESNLDSMGQKVVTNTTTTLKQ